MEATDPVTITLQAQQWNTILEVLHNAPYRVAAPLIQSISELRPGRRPFNRATAS